MNGKWDADERRWTQINLKAVYHEDHEGHEEKGRTTGRCIGYTVVEFKFIELVRLVGLAKIRVLAVVGGGLIVDGSSITKPPQFSSEPDLSHLRHTTSFDFRSICHRHIDLFMIFMVFMVNSFIL